jgi:cytochrome c-type biogenesis protein CcmH
MTDAMLGAVIALSTATLTLWISDKFLTMSAAQGESSSADAAIAPLLYQVGKARWRALLLAALVALAAAAFAGGVAPTRLELALTSPKSADMVNSDGGMAETYDRLRAFAAGNDSPPASLPMSPVPSTAEGLADVATMIDKLAARLEREPNDTAGWRMLGWSYFHTDRFADAVAAYDRAIALDPGNAELIAARDEAKRAGGESKGPTEADDAAAAEMPDADRQAMIAGMVDGLAGRLAGAPRDEAGWIKLMRSRMVLGQPDAAAKDLATAKQAFAGEADVLTRLDAAARELGVPGG